MDDSVTPMAAGTRTGAARDVVTEDLATKPVATPAGSSRTRPPVRPARDPSPGIRSVPADLLWPADHEPMVRRHRATCIADRTRKLAFLFAVCTLIWIPVDFYVLEADIASFLALLRVAVAVASAGLFWRLGRKDRLDRASSALLAVFLIPVAFFLVTSFFIDWTGVPFDQQVYASGYAFLPFVLIACIALFPLSLLEAGAIGLTAIAVMSVSLLFGKILVPFADIVAALWLLLLLCGVAAAAAMSQLQFMIMLVRQSSNDSLTDAYMRGVGEELLAVLYSVSERSDTPFSVVFVDLDDFKMVNDQFGHEEGDAMLKRAVERFRQTVRRGDLIIRWGGEEFVLVLPNTDHTGAESVVSRLRETGIAARPDGVLQTVSIGIAERIADDADGWSGLVEKADRRMYAAKGAGKNCVFGRLGRRVAA